MVRLIKPERQKTLSGHCTDAIMGPSLRIMAMPQAQMKMKTERIDVRVSPKAKDALQQAAALTNKSVSEYLLDAGLEAAAETLADRRVFALDEKQWRKFQELLDRPPQFKPRLVELLSEPGVFEKARRS